MARVKFGIWAANGKNVLFFALLFALFCAGRACGQEDAPASGTFDVKAHYTRREARIPMRDGVHLFTVIYTPKDTTSKHPLLMERTPYSVPYGADTFPRVLGPSESFGRAGYVMVYQDVRGKFMSEGDFVNMRPHHEGKFKRKEIDETTDTYDTIDWLVKNVPNNNGRVGLWGISYPGFYAAMGGINSHPALKAISPQAPCTDWFVGDDDYHNGAFFLIDNFDFAPFDRPRKGTTTEWGKDFDYHSDDAYTFFLNMGPLSNSNTKYFHDGIPFWNEMLQHDTYDAFWKAHNPLPHVRNVRAAVLTTGGWFDAEDLYGALHLFPAVARFNSDTPNYLAMGPWSHGGWAGGPFDHFGDIAWGQPTGEYYRTKIEFPFFDYYLRGVGSPPTAKAQVFETGTNQWRAFAQWPPAGLQSQTVTLQAGHKLAFGRGAEAQPKMASADDAATTDYDAYESDPANPVPYSPVKSIRRNSLYMIEDQRFASSRPDVLSYQSEPLPAPMTLAGPMVADLSVATTGTDGDFIVKVIDVYPDDAPETSVGGKTVKLAGYQQLVRAEVMRGKFRSSYEKPRPFVPGQITKVKFTLNDVCHTLLKGHRLMVQVQSSWFPLVDRNPQTFCDIATAPESAFRKATMRVYHTPQHPSRVTFGILPAR